MDGWRTKARNPTAPEIQEIAEHGWIDHADEIPEANSVEDMQEVVEETTEHATEWGFRPNGDKCWHDEVTDRLAVKEPNGKGMVYNPRPPED